MSALQRAPIVRAVPSVRDIKDNKIREVLEALKENIELLTGNNANNTYLDKALSLRDLHNYGLADVVVNGRVISNGNPDTSKAIFKSGESVTNVTNITQVDGGSQLNLSKPPTLTNLTAAPTQTGVLVQFDDPESDLYAYAEIWTAPTNDFSQATLEGTTDGFIYPDFIGSTGVTKFYWVRPVSINAVLGDFNAVDGVEATTGGAVGDGILNSDSANFLNANIAHANIYSLNVSKIQSGTIRADRYIAVGNGVYRVIIDGQGNVRSGKTGYASGGNGFFAGISNGLAKFDVGSNVSYIRFNGLDIEINTPQLYLSNGNATFSGTLQSASMIGGTINIGSNKFSVDSAGNVVINSGGFTGYAWPLSGQTGYHISAAGALWGNFNNGNYIQLTSDGFFALINNGQGIARTTTGVTLYGDVVVSSNIKNGAVGTLKIGVDAITIGRSALGSTRNFVVVNNWETVVSVPITSTGQPISILANVGLYIVGFTGVQVSGRILRDGVQITSMILSYGIRDVANQSGDNYYYHTGVFPMAFKDFAPAGYHNYAYQIYVPDSNVQVGRRMITPFIEIKEVKR